MPPTLLPHRVSAVAFIPPEAVGVLGVTEEATNLAQAVVVTAMSTVGNGTTVADP